MKKLRLTILLSPYLILTFLEFQSHSKFNLFYLFLFFVSLFIFDHYITLKRKVSRCLAGFVIFLFYVEIIIGSFHIERNILSFIMIAFIFISFFLLSSYFASFLNTFCLILCIVILISNRNNFNTINTSSYSKVNFKERVNSTPILIIILDEYSSPSEVSKNNSLITFLNNNNFDIIDPIYTTEIFTINSVASMLNYDISSDNSFRNNLQEIDRFELIVNSQFERDLNNYGFELVMKNYYRVDESLLYFPNYFMCPRNFAGVLLYKSFIPRIERNILGENSFVIYNMSLFRDLQYQISNSGFKENTVYLYHFCMPHPPFKFNSEYKGAEDYEKYYSFVNTKFSHLINKIIVGNDIRIIIMGDHGKRGEVRFDPKKTFAAFLNFNSISLSKLTSVQSICKVIIEDL